MEFNNTLITNINIDINKLSIDNILEYKYYYSKLPENTEIFIYLPDWFIEFIDKKNIKFYTKDKLILYSKYLKCFINTYSYLNKIAINYFMKDMNNVKLYQNEENELKICINKDIELQALQNEKINIDDNIFLEFIYNNILKTDINENNNEIYKNTINHIKWFLLDYCDNLILYKIMNKNNYEFDNLYKLFIKSYCEYLCKELYADYYFIHYENNKFDGNYLESKNLFPEKINNAIKELNNRKKAKSLLYDNIDINYFTRLQNNKKRLGIAINVNKLLNYDNKISFVYKISYI